MSHGRLFLVLKRLHEAVLLPGVSARVCAGRSGTAAEYSSRTGLRARAIHRTGPGAAANSPRISDCTTLDESRQVACRSSVFGADAGDLSRAGSRPGRSGHSGHSRGSRHPGAPGTPALRTLGCSGHSGEPKSHCVSSARGSGWGFGAVSPESPPAHRTTYRLGGFWAPHARAAGHGPSRTPIGIHIGGDVLFRAPARDGTPAAAKRYQR